MDIIDFEELGIHLNFVSVGKYSGIYNDAYIEAQDLGDSCMVKVKRNRDGKKRRKVVDNVSDLKRLLMDMEVL